jgi:hypothetical protein
MVELENPGQISPLQVFSEDWAMGIGPKVVAASYSVKMV